MSMRHADDGTGNSEHDWEIFDVLCKNVEKVCAALIIGLCKFPRLVVMFINNPFVYCF